jgi:hypothetical protein
VQLLYRIAEAVVEEPDGTIRTVLFPQVKEEIFQDLAAEAKASGPQYRIWYQYVMRQKYIHHYRQMLPWVLEHLTFRSENRFQPVIEALAVIKQSLRTKGQYFPADVPVEGVVLPSWRDTVIEKDGVSHVLAPSEGSSKLIPIHAESNHQIMHLFCLGKAQRPTH